MDYNNNDNHNKSFNEDINYDNKYDYLKNNISIPEFMKLMNDNIKNRFDKHKKKHNIKTFKEYINLYQ